MNAEEAGQQQAGLVRHVAARPPFELGEIGQADPLLGLLSDELDDLGLRQRAGQPTAGALQLSQRSELVAQSHSLLIANKYSADCPKPQDTITPCFIG